MAATSTPLPHKDSNLLESEVSAILLGFEVVCEEKKLRVTFPSGERRYSTTVTEFQLALLTDSVCTSLPELEAIIRSAIIQSNGATASLQFNGDSKIVLAIDIVTHFFARSFCLELWLERSEDLQTMVKRLESRIDDLETRLAASQAVPSEPLALLFLKMDSKDHLDQYLEHLLDRPQHHQLSFSLFPPPPTTFKRLHRALYIRTPNLFECAWRTHQPMVSFPVFYPPPLPLSSYSLVIHTSQAVKSWLSDPPSSVVSQSSHHRLPDDVIDDWKKVALERARIGWFSYTLPASSDYRVVLDSWDVIPHLPKLKRALSSLRIVFESELAQYSFYTSNFPKIETFTHADWKVMLSIDAQSRTWPVILVHLKTKRLIFANPFPAYFLIPERDSEAKGSQVIPAGMNLLWTAMFDAAADMLG